MPDEAAFDEAMDVFKSLRREQIHVEAEGDWVQFQFSHNGTEYEFHVDLWSGGMMLETSNPHKTIYINR